MDYDISKDTICVKDRILPKDPLKFYNYNQETRVTVTITNDPAVWREDLCIGERLFSDLIIIPAHTSMEQHMTEFDLVKKVLKERLKYPDIKENKKLLEVAKTWILPTKIHMGPSTTTFFSPVENPVQIALAPLFSSLKIEPKIHYLKIEVPNGFERTLLYTILDNGFRPSLILVKWSNDLDDHILTAQCAGHIQNVGYNLVSLEKEYALYMFSDSSLYDVCSFKSVGLKNPIFTSLFESFSESFTSSIQQKPVEQESIDTTTSS
jgi:hypothetical protein